MIEHLDPTHPSLMAELLSSHTSMTVVQAVDGSRQSPIMSISSLRGSLAIRDGLFRLSTPKERHGARLPFDFFLGSLAEACGEQAACVVLSGTGDDGSRGVIAIKERGGLVIAQDPHEAAFDGMPSSAIQPARSNSSGRSPTFQMSFYDAFIRLCLELWMRQNASRPGRRRSSGKSSRSYTTRLPMISVSTRGTLERRLDHRMSAVRIADRSSYLKLLRQKPEEAELLRKDLLIGVTQFFRGKTAFDFLSDKVIPNLVKRHRDEQPIRVWCPGCRSLAKRHIRLQYYSWRLSPR